MSHATSENELSDNSNCKNNKFEDDAEKLHTSYGAGLRIAMNENFIIAIDYGLATDKRDGNSGFYKGLTSKGLNHASGHMPNLC